MWTLSWHERDKVGQLWVSSTDDLNHQRLGGSPITCNTASHRQHTVLYCSRVVCYHQAMARLSASSVTLVPASLVTPSAPQENASASTAPMRTADTLPVRLVCMLVFVCMPCVHLSFSNVMIWTGFGHFSNKVGQQVKGSRNWKVASWSPFGQIWDSHLTFYITSVCVSVLIPAWTCVHLIHWNLLFCCMHFGIFKVTESGSQIKKIQNSKMNVQQITCILKTVNSDLELKLAWYLD